ncbi:Retrovirus-related Pol polyprotein from type-2 retrotransposable element R2DM [Varanus komodoensis]|nr:Retrovirus-related Pol polyprotein from type-2 retrotransposable element R2DM [Varanus komodoensis]
MVVEYLMWPSLTQTLPPVAPRNLYADQEATVRTGHVTIEWFKTGKGVQQGCILSPYLFNLYSEHIMRKAGLDKSQIGIKIAGRYTNNLRYSDDSTLMAESKEELKDLLMRVKEESTKVGLKLNIKKIKIMASSPITSCTLPTKVHIVKAMVFPVTMYGCESWTIRKAERQRIEGFELWCWRRLLRVPWTARRSNQSVLEEINPDCSLEAQILKMKLKYFGHLMRRKDSLEKSLMLGTIDGKRRRGRQRMRKRTVFRKTLPEREKIQTTKTHQKITNCRREYLTENLTLLIIAVFWDLWFIPSVLLLHQLNCFANDGKCDAELGETVAVLNWCLAKIMGWMRANKLKLNPDKMEVLLVGDLGFRVSDLGPALDGVVLPLKDRVRSLGVLLDPELSLEAQVTAVNPKNLRLSCTPFCPHNNSPVSIFWVPVRMTAISSIAPYQLFTVEPLSSAIETRDPKQASVVPSAQDLETNEINLATDGGNMIGLGEDAFAEPQLTTWKLTTVEFLHSIVIKCHPVDLLEKLPIAGLLCATHSLIGCD